MPATQLALNVVITKLASGNILMQFEGPGGDVRFAAVMLTADMTTTQSSVNLGAAGASFTMKYTQDQTRTDLPPGLS